MPGEFLGAFAGFFEAADVEEGLLGQVVAPCRSQISSKLRERVGDLGVVALLAGELLGDEERLAEEALDLAGPADDELVLFGQFIDAQDGDDVLQVAVALEHALHLAGDAVVLFADDAADRGRGEAEASGSTAG